MGRKRQTIFDFAAYLPAALLIGMLFLGNAYISKAQSIQRVSGGCINQCKREREDCSQSDVSDLKCLDNEQDCLQRCQPAEQNPGYGTSPGGSSFLDASVAPSCPRTGIVDRTHRPPTGRRTACGYGGDLSIGDREGKSERKAFD